MYNEDKVVHIYPTVRQENHLNHSSSLVHRYSINVKVSTITENHVHTIQWTQQNQRNRHFQLSLK
jgi:hypothetical protein